MRTDTNDTRTNLHELFQGRLSRRRLLKTAIAAGLVGTLVPTAAGAASASAMGSSSSATFPFFPQVPSGSYTPESIEEIVGNLLTHQYLHLNAVFGLLTTPALAKIHGLTSGLPQAHFQSLIVVHQNQIDFWSSLVPAAKPVTTTFSISAALATDPLALLVAADAVDGLRAATGLAAVREFAELGQPTLAKYAAQTAGVDEAIRVGIRFLGALAGVPTDIPPVNKAFMTDYVLYTRDSVAILRALGLIGGSEIALPYPGRAAALAAAGPVAGKVVQKQPNNATSTVTVTGLASLTSERS